MNKRRLALAIIGLVVGLTACGDSRTSGTATTEQALLARLEARPLKLPVIAIGDPCPATGLSVISPYKDNSRSFQAYGPGPIYGQPVQRTDSTTNSYFDIVYYGNPTVRRLALVRMKTLDGKFKGVFVGDYGAGPVIGADTISEKQTDLYGEGVLPLSRADQNPELAKGWATWHVRQGIDSHWRCIGIQIDTESASEAIVIL